MTWDPKEKVYRDHSLWYDSADQWTYVGHFEGDALVYRGEFEFDGKHVKFRSETRPKQGGGFTLDEFGSVDGGPEQKVLRGTAVPRAQAELLQKDVLTLKRLEQDWLDSYRWPLFQKKCMLSVSELDVANDFPSIIESLGRDVSSEAT